MIEKTVCAHISGFRKARVLKISGSLLYFFVLLFGLFLFCSFSSLLVSPSLFSLMSLSLSLCSSFCSISWYGAI
ncbi:hypothetical protein [Enterococcus phage PEF1]